MTMTLAPIEVLDGTPLNEVVRRTFDEVQRIIDTWDKSTISVYGKAAGDVDDALAYMSYDSPSFERTAIDMLREAGRNSRNESGARPEYAIWLTCQLALFSMKLQAAGENTSTIHKQFANLSKLRMCLRDVVQRANAADIDEAINSLIENPVYREIVRTALDITGPDGRIFVEKDAGIHTPEVEVKVGYNFYAIQPIMAAVHMQQWKYSNVRVACIDGYCETAAELDRILSAAHEAHEPLLLLARQFSDEVLHTIAVNNRRGTLCVMPVLVPFDADSANVLKDIAVIAGGEVTSSFEGRLISTIDFYALPTVNEVTCIESSLTIVEPSTIDDVNAHINALAGKMRELTVSSDFLARRIQALSARTTYIRVPTLNLRDAFSIELALKRVKSTMIHGIVTYDHILDSIKRLDMSPGLKKIMEQWAQMLPRKSALAIHVLDSCLANAIATSEVLSTSGCALVPLKCSNHR